MEYAANPRAGFDYEILETLEAGLILKGFEVKAIRAGKASLRGAYVKIIGGKPMLIGAHIAPYQPGNPSAGGTDYDPDASRPLLLGKREIRGLVGLAKERGLTLVPLKLYPKGRRIKLLIGIAKGKKKYDKREALKNKDIARARQRGMADE